MADKQKSQAKADRPEQAPGEQTAEQIHAARREGEAEARAASGMDRHGKRGNQDG
jgi:hypothetical protein